MLQPNNMFTHRFVKPRVFIHRLDKTAHAQQRNHCVIFTNCDALAPWSSVLCASLGLTDVRGLADVLDNLDILCDLCVMLRKLSSLRYKQSFARTLETVPRWVLHCGDGGFLTWQSAIPHAVLGLLGCVTCLHASSMSSLSSASSTSSYFFSIRPSCAFWLLAVAGLCLKPQPEKRQAAAKLHQSCS